MGWWRDGQDGDNELAPQTLHQSSYLILRTTLGAVFLPSLEVRKQRLRKDRALVQNCGASGRTRLQWRQKPCCPELVLLSTAQHFLRGGLNEVRHISGP